MKTITKEQLIQIAQRLMINPADKVLDDILIDWEELQHHVSVLNKINTDNVKPLTHINEDLQIDFLREDEENWDLMINKNIILENAPENDSDYVTITKVVE